MPVPDYLLNEIGVKIMLGCLEGGEGAAICKCFRS